MKIEYKKNYKELYLPKQTPSIIEIPAIPYIMIDGKGNPNGEEFALVVAALYSLSYAIKMSYKQEIVPEGYYEYTVFPLEGIWDLFDKDKPLTDKNNFKYTLMMRQPDFLTPEMFEAFLEQTKRKKSNLYLDSARFEILEEGLCCQMMHIGSYDDEPASFEKMEAYCENNGYKRIYKIHKEIYLSDPRRVAVEKLKTVLRFKVARE